jgi:hypothetical protein
MDKQTSMPDAVDFIAGMYTGLSRNKKIRTFFSIAKYSLGVDWISNRGIKDKYDMSHREFFDSHFFSENSDMSIESLFEIKSIETFANELLKELKNIHSSGIGYDEILKDVHSVFEEGTSHMNIWIQKINSPITKNPIDCGVESKIEIEEEGSGEDISIKIPVGEIINKSILKGLYSDNIIEIIRGIVKEEVSNALSSITLNLKR